MNVEFDWRAGDEGGQWETVAEVTGRTRYEIPWRTLGVLMVALLGLPAASTTRTVSSPLRISSIRLFASARHGASSSRPA